MSICFFDSMRRPTDSSKVLLWQKNSLAFRRLTGSSSQFEFLCYGVDGSETIPRQRSEVELG